MKAPRAKPVGFGHDKTLFIALHLKTNLMIFEINDNQRVFCPASPIKIGENASDTDVRRLLKFIILEQYQNPAQGN